MELSDIKPFRVKDKINDEEYLGYSEFRKLLINASKKEDETIVTEDEKIIFKILEQNIKNAAKAKEESYSIPYWDFIHNQMFNMLQYSINLSENEFAYFMNKFAEEKGLDVKIYCNEKAENATIINDLGATFSW